MSRKPIRYRVIVFRQLEEPYDDYERSNWEGNINQNLDEQWLDGYSIVAVTPGNDTLVYTLERKP